MYQQATQVRIAPFTDSAQARFPTARMLSRYQPDPGCELPGRSKLFAAVDRRDDRRRRQRSDAGDGFQALARFIRAVPGKQFGLKFLEAGRQHGQLIDEKTKHSARQIGNTEFVRVVEHANQLADAARALSRNNTQLSEMPTQRVDDHRSLTDNEFARPMQHEHRLLVGALHGRKSHRRTCYGFADASVATPSRRSRFLRTTRPSASAPCSWKTFFARSSPTVAIAIVNLPRLDQTSTLIHWHVDAVTGGRSSHLILFVST